MKENTRRICSGFGYKMFYLFPRPLQSLSGKIGIELNLIELCQFRASVRAPGYICF